jgi:hypothetical protein
VRGERRAPGVRRAAGRRLRPHIVHGEGGARDIVQARDRRKVDRNRRRGSGVVDNKHCHRRRIERLGKELGKCADNTMWAGGLDIPGD